MKSLREVGSKLRKMGMKANDARKFIKDNMKLYNKVCHACQCHMYASGSDIRDLSGFCDSCRPIVKKVYSKYVDEKDLEQK